MYRVLDCLSGQHDYRLVGVAAVVCILASFAAFWLYPSAKARTGVRRWLLVLLAGACTAAGIWTTHFVGMLAYDAGLPVNYDLILTIASLLIAIIGTTAGFALMTGRRVVLAALGGAVIGLGISGMHFTGMEAVIVAGRLTWDPILVPVSIVAGAVLASASAVVHIKCRGRWSSIGAPMLLMLAICAMHFTAMASVTFTSDPTVQTPAWQIDRLSLAFMITAVAMLLMLASIFASMMDRFTIARGMLGYGGSVLATLLATVVIGGYTLEQVRIGGESYNQVSASKDLIADILPPPAFIIEAYLEARMAVEEPEQLARRRLRLAALRKSYLERRDHWRASGLISDEIKHALTVRSDAVVGHFWQELDAELLPALESGNRVAAVTSLRRLTSHYIIHRAIIDDIVAQAQTFASATESAAVTRAEFFKKLVLSSVLLLVLVIGAALHTLRGFVIKPVLAMADYLKTLASGRYGEKLPFTTRADEVGTMAMAIETLRLASVEKQRLEAEALEVRQQADKVRATREKEKAAEAMRLNMANESITSLNNELNDTIERLKQVQDEIVRKGKLAQLGQLTATVAHEIRNPLGAIKTAAFLIERKTKDKGLGIEGPLQRVNNGILRCDNIITELLDFTRTKTLSRTSQCLDDWVKSVLDDERRNLPAEVEIVSDFGTAPVPLQFDASRMRRVMINLLSNASEAMVGKGGGAETAQTAHPRIVISSRIEEGNVEMVFADNGPGISEENLAKIREPLFTTKSFGVGLGLPAVENVLEQHGGGLRIESRLGLGTTVVAWFPVKLGTPESTAEPASERQVA